jgi:hypothetical protein
MPSVVAVYQHTTKNLHTTMAARQRMAARHCLFFGSAWRRRRPRCYSPSGAGNRILARRDVIAGERLVDGGHGVGWSAPARRCSSLAYSLGGATRQPQPRPMHAVVLPRPPTPPPTPSHPCIVCHPRAIAVVARSSVAA